MVHHGLDPGQTGNLAQRRLYVNLLAFPAGKLPRVAQGDAAAALAEGVLYGNDPKLPTQPKAAYLYLVHNVSGSFSNDSYSRILADGQVACRDLETHQDVRQMLQSLRKRGLNPFEAYLAAIFSTKYFCPQYVQEALVDVRQSLVGVQ
jgi:hypothetical protein